MGNYALGLGVVKALSQGMEAKFRDRLTRAQALNPGYEQGAVETAWGRFFDKLPWPKRDRKKAEEHLRKAIEMNPNALRPRVYLASSYLDADRAMEAKHLLDEVAAAVPGRYDAPEERRAQALGAGADADAAGETEVSGPDPRELPQAACSPALRGARGNEFSGAMRAPRRALLRP